MKNLSTLIKTLQNIMRKDQGVSGDAQRIEQQYTSGELLAMLQESFRKSATLVARLKKELV
jgi:hypothetical protein